GCVVEIGEVPISLQTGDERFLDLVRKRYRGYLSSAEPELELRLDPSARGPVSDEDVSVRREGSDWIVERGDFHARWNVAGRVEVRLSPSPYALDSILRILHSLVLAERGGFLLHAGSAICDGRAFLFSGVSGAGKTTITRLAPPGVTVLT